jgi:peroxiredoxin
VQLVQLQADLNTFQEADIRVVGISHDAIELLSDFSAEKGIQFPLLSDPASKTIEAYGNLARTGKGVSRPEGVLLDSKGVVRAKLSLEWCVGPPLIDALLEAAPAKP